ncbi:MAG: peptidoglycan DD-metalloendopeptidase family protein [Chitinophagales bacterium]
MDTRKWIKILTFCILCGVFGLVFAFPTDDTQRLRSEKEKLQQEIAQTNQLLQEVAAKKENTMGELRILQSQLSSRQELLNTIKKEITDLQSIISLKEDSLDLMRKDVKLLLDNYAQSVRYAYKTRKSYSNLSFVLSAANFNQAYKRLKYLQYINRQHKARVAAIEDKQAFIQQKVAELSEEKAAQEVLYADADKETDKIRTNKSRQDAIMSKLKKEEKTLKKEVAEKETAIRKLDAEIANIINAEMGKDANLAAAPSVALEKLSSSFSKNKGKLPWPVESGIVTGTFGKNKHPFLKNIFTTNNGVNIATAKGAQVKAIADGTVSSILFNPTFQSAVIVKHGEYFSVYTNLSKVYVARGDEVKIGNIIGEVYTDEAENKTEVHLEIWKGTKKLDPSTWIARR